MQFGLYQLGDIRFGEGSYYGVDPGKVRGFDHDRTPSFRTFVVPASDRYNEMQARFDGLVIGSKLDYRIDWRAWLKDDVIFSSVWTDVRGGVLPTMPNPQVVETDDPPPREQTTETNTIMVGDTTISGLSPVVSDTVIEPEVDDDELAINQTDTSGTTGTSVQPTEPVTEETATLDTALSASVLTSVGDFEESIALSFDETRVTLGVASVFYMLTGNRTVTLTNSITTLKGRSDDRTVVLNSGDFRESLVYEQDPDAVLDYLFDFGGFLDPGEYLLQNPGFYHTPGLRIHSRVLKSRSVVAFIGGGSLEMLHEFTIGVRTSLGKILYGRMGLRIVQK